MEDKMDYEELKMAINNLLWTYLPDNTTLYQAEDIATEIIGVISDKLSKPII